MKIVKIQKQGSETAAVVLESGESLTVFYELLMKRGLKTGYDIPDDALESLINENQSLFIKQSAFRFLNRRWHSESELKLKLQKKGFRKDLISGVTESLKASAFLDDYKFAVGFKEEKINRYGWGKEFVAAGLRKKGVASDIIKEVLSDFSTEDSLQTAVKLLEKKYRFKSAETLEPLKTKLYNYLFSKGYDYNTCRTAVDNYINSRISPEE